MLYVDSKSAENIRAELKINRGGIETKVLAVEVGLSPATVANYLQAMRDVGLAVYVPGAPKGGKWCAPEYADAIRAEYDVIRAETAARRKAKKYADGVARREREREALEAISDFPFIRKVVPAHAAEMIRPVGPASVWELGRYV